MICKLYEIFAVAKCDSSDDALYLIDNRNGNDVYRFIWEVFLNMNQVDVLDNGVVFNNNKLTFPLSYKEISELFGEARISVQNDIHFSYYYDELGISFEGSTAFLGNLKKKKAYRDDEHNIVSMTLYVTGEKVFGDSKTEKCYIGGLSVLNKNISRENIYPHILGYGYNQWIKDEQGKSVPQVHMDITMKLEDDLKKNEVPIYDGDQILLDVNIVFAPERPMSNENYNITIPDEPCLTFDTFNFKLAVIQELMYNQEVLKPYFDIYDYMIFKKKNWNLETDKNVRAAVSFFKELPIPTRFAELVKEINMDGDDDIYMQIAPEWDGRDERFDFNKVTKAEIEQFVNLKKMLIFGNEHDAEKLSKICEPLGIEVEPLAYT